ncbi:MAG TPA: ABC transporter permease [Chthoniobacterales bacterium]
MSRHVSNMVSVLAVFAGAVAVWYAIIWLGKVEPFMLPPPTDVLDATVKKHASLLMALRTTATTAVLGFLSSLVVGVAVAIVFGEFGWVRKMFFPYTVVLQSVPIVATAPLIIMWIGTGTLSMVVVTFIMCVSPIIANTTQGLISVERNLVDLFLMNNASRAQVLWKLRIPHALPSMFVGARISAGISSMGAIVGELFTGANRIGEGGLGYTINYANTQLQTGFMFALVVTSIALGLGLVFVVTFFEWLLLHNWHESARNKDRE